MSIKVARVRRGNEQDVPNRSQGVKAVSGEGTREDEVGRQLRLGHCIVLLAVVNHILGHGHNVIDGLGGHGISVSFAVRNATLDDEAIDELVIVLVVIGILDAVLWGYES